MPVGKGSIARVNKLKEQQPLKNQLASEISSTNIQEEETIFVIAKDNENLDTINHNTIPRRIVHSLVVTIDNLNSVPPEWDNHKFTRGNVEELKSSIVKFGVLEPLLVRKLENEGFQILSGNMRYEACRELGIKEIRCEVLENIDDETACAIFRELQANKASKAENQVSLHEFKFKAVSNIKQALPDYLL